MGNAEISNYAGALTVSQQRLAELFAYLGTGLLRLFPAELAHELGMWALERGVLNILPEPYLAPLPVGMRTVIPGVGELDHPIGLAAGFDKNARCPQAFARMGFSFIEVGTVTPKGQPGNPKPRLFRQSEQHALINRMGFNGDGSEAVAARIRSYKWPKERVPLGINCGKNKDTPADLAIDDYLRVITAFDELASYFVVNISSPNTPGLRDLATPEFIESLAYEVGSKAPKIWIKLDPDMERPYFQKMIAAITKQGFRGVILTNTHRVVYPEVGGQSGHPLMALSTACLEWAYAEHRGTLPMIASGGIFSGADVYAKLIRGAAAVQIYAALVYQGPWVVQRLLRELAAELKLRGFSHVRDAVGTYYV